MPRTAIRTTPLPDHAEWSRLHCSFCGKDANHVRFLSAGVAGMICDACCFKAFLIFVKAWIRWPLGVSRT
jgi:ClpX C4-type zinc finger